MSNKCDLDCCQGSIVNAFKSQYQLTLGHRELILTGSPRKIKHENTI